MKLILIGTSILLFGAMVGCGGSQPASPQVGSDQGFESTKSVDEPATPTAPTPAAPVQEKPSGSQVASVATSEKAEPDSSGQTKVEQESTADAGSESAGTFTTGAAAGAPWIDGEWLVNFAVVSMAELQEVSAKDRQVIMDLKGVGFKIAGDRYQRTDDKGSVSHEGQLMVSPVPEDESRGMEGDVYVGHIDAAGKKSQGHRFHNDDGELGLVLILPDCDLDYLLPLKQR